MQKKNIVGLKKFFLNEISTELQKPNVEAEVYNKKKNFFKGD